MNRLLRRLCRPFATWTTTELDRAPTSLHLRFGGIDMDVENVTQFSVLRFFAWVYEVRVDRWFDAAHDDTLTLKPEYLEMLSDDD